MSNFGACPVLDTLEAVLRWQGGEQDRLYHNSESSTQAAPTLVTHHSLTRSYRDLMPRLTSIEATASSKYSMVMYDVLVDVNVEGELPPTQEYHNIVTPPYSIVVPILTAMAPRRQCGHWQSATCSTTLIKPTTEYHGLNYLPSTPSFH